MKTITHIYFILLVFGFVTNPRAYAQEPSNTPSIAIPAENMDVTEFKNTFVDYHSYILNDETFRFRNESKKRGRLSNICLC